MSDARWYALMRFVGFGVLMGLVPLVFVYVVRSFIDGQSADATAHPFGRGALFLLTATTAATAVGTLAVRPPTAPLVQLRKLSVAVGIIGGLVGLLGALAYGAASNADPETLQGGTVILESVSSYVAAVVIGAICVLLSEQSPVNAPVRPAP